MKVLRSERYATDDPLEIEITMEDVGRKDYPFGELLGRVEPFDVGKRMKRTGGTGGTQRLWFIENQAQWKARIARAPSHA